MKTIMKYITPAIAEELIKYRKRTNPIKQTKLNKIKNMMLSGRWKNKIGTPIVVKNSELLDGYHRLTAIIETRRCYLIPIESDDSITL
jgi:hypothetical protein